MPAPGPDKELCGAQRPNKPKGVTCRLVAGYKTDHLGVGRCYRHGGATESHERSAQMVIARQACVRLGVPIPADEADPGLILIGLVREAAGNVEFYRSLVADLPTHPHPDDEWEDKDGNVHVKQGKTGIYGRTYHQSGIPTGEAKPHVLVVMYNEERDRLARFVKEVLGAGIEERRVRLEEADARTLMEGFSKAVTAAKLSPEQTEVLRRVFADHLRQSRAPGLAG